ncbi:hypothetical protein EQG41_11150 [Billgrantia azerbaijanica]|nr:hypothetical protein EQG41_11150 [Halomonas azerbaijanica]
MQLPWLMALAILLNASAQVTIKLAGQTGIDRTGIYQWLSPWLLLALTCYGLSFLLTVKLYAVNPLSVVAPFMAACIFLLIYVAGVMLFSEAITWQKTLGLTFIIIGILFLSR